MGRTHTDDQAGRTIAELVLPRTFRQGESTWYEYEVEWADVADAERESSSSRLLPSLLPLLSLDVVFASQVPESVEYWTEPADSTTGVTRELPVVDGHAQVVVADAGPGVHRLRWL